MKNALLKTVSSFQWGPAAKSWIMQWKSLGEVMGAMNQWLSLTPEEKYDLLAEDSRKARAERIEKIIYEYTATMDVTNEAKNAQEDDNQKAYREQAIRKQMEYLQKELDERHPENVDDIRKMEKRVQESGMNEEARKEADKVLSRLKTEGANSPEYGNI